LLSQQGKDRGNRSTAVREFSHWHRGSHRK
jgi:hypothetical protein